MKYIQNGRIVVENMPRLFEKTGLTPICGGWGNDSAGTCGCLATALLVHKLGKRKTFDVLIDAKPRVDLTEAVAHYLHLDEHYVLGLIAGFDGEDSNMESFDKNGVDDGMAAAKLVRPMYDYPDFL
jgi:hypothetical protein